ncbi:DM13 domain-containing protein [Litoricolaceae bacterium]|nr:DM13 domain-containing protein [Litorivicinaceae bacterium]
MMQNNKRFLKGPMPMDQEKHIFTDNSRWKWVIRWLATHMAATAFGFALGVYLLPILTQPPSPDQMILSAAAESALYAGEFQRDLDGSDFFHWGVGTVSLTADSIVHQGSLAPGPDYMAYLSPVFVSNEAEFLAVKDQSLSIGSVKTFDGFMLPLTAQIPLGDFKAVIIWCEAFGEFITAAELAPSR